MKLVRHALSIFVIRAKVKSIGRVVGFQDDSKFKLGVQFNSMSMLGSGLGLGLGLG
jgi:small-conductance mechanosensitive channel